MTGGSYGTECDACGEKIKASARFCPDCGEQQEWISDDRPEEFVDIRDIHPDWSEMECWNCGHTERVGPNRHMMICNNCFMDNNATDDETSFTVEGPDGEFYVDYRDLWYGDVSIEEAKRRYESNTKDVNERFERQEARDRTVRI